MRKRGLDTAHALAAAISSSVVRECKLILRHRVVMLLVVSAMIGTLMCSVAQAIEFVWYIGAAKLTEGSVVKLKYIHGNTKITLTDPRFTVVCNLLEGKTPVIAEELRGTHRESLELKECKVTEPAMGCQVREEKIVTGPLEGEIVEGLGESRGKVLLEFAGKENGNEEEVMGITIEKVGAAVCAPAGATATTYHYVGRLLAEALGGKTIKVVQKYKFEPVEANNFWAFVLKQYAAGLRSGCGRLRLTGEILAELESEEPFGPF
jgi:hypothetical protein